MSEEMQIQLKPGSMNSPRLGLVCITTSPEIRFKTITRTRFLARDDSERIEALSAVYKENTRRLGLVPKYCREHGINLYRLISNLYPFLETPEGREAMKPLKASLGEIGEEFNRSQIRIVNHPDPFVVLNSESTNVIANSRLILETQAWILDHLKQPVSPWALIEIHGGKAGRAQQLVDEIGRLDDNIRLRIGIENDEYAFGADEILEICRQAHVPMVFDAHHHVIHEKLADFTDSSISFYTEAARETWNPKQWQLVHISNGRGHHLDRHHSDLITVMPDAYSNVPWIEIEAKKKEQAIDWLKNHWAPASSSKI